MTDLILQQVVNGLSVGMTYALVALGLTLTFGVLHVINFAHGEFYMLGALCSGLLVSLFGLPYLLTIPLAVIGTMAVAAVIDRVAVRPVLRTAEGSSFVLISTFAVSIILYQGVLVAVGPSPIAGIGLEGAITVGPLAITTQRLFIIVGGVVLVGLVELALRQTRFGRSLRAVSQSAFAAQVIGIDVQRVRGLTFCLAGGLAGLAGALIVPVTSFNATMGQHAIINAFVIVVVGGMGNVTGAVVCGLALGIVESVASIGLPQEIANAIVYSLLLVALLVRPAGLFARS